MILEGYFFGIGLLVLIKLVWEDYNNKCMVNQSNSAFMIGVVASMYVFNNAYMAFFAFMLLIPLVFSLRGRLTKGWFAKNFSVGEGDTIILTWIIAGLFLVNVFSVFIFLLFWLIVNVVTGRYYSEFIGTPSIFFAFICTWFVVLFL